MKKFLFLIISLISAGSLNGQDNNLTLQLNNILFRDLVDTIERRIPVRIYYSDTWVDNLYLTISSEKSTLDEVLGRSLLREGFTFLITEENKVILSKGYKIKTSFRKEYLDHLKNIYKTADTAEFVRPVLQKDERSISDEFRVYRIGKPSAGGSGDKIILSGVIRSADDGQFIAGAVVYVEKLKAGAMTNNTGFYSLPLPAGQHQIDYRMVGMRPASRHIIIHSDGTMDVNMSESTRQLDEVIVSANRENIVKNVKTGIEKINIKTLKQMPMGLGEADVIKSSLLLPGVQTVGEASGGYNVRGGNVDQNLVLLNNAPIINSSHFFGFFSAFNSDMISDVTLYKSGMPAKYGGRLSSVMEIAPVEGDRLKLKVSGGIRKPLGSYSVENIKDTLRYGRGNVVRTYPGLEFRISSRFILSEGSSVKLGIQRVLQYIHMISNTTSISPTDVWKLSNNHIRPQRSDQLSVGFYNNSRRRAVETSIEAYYKRLDNILDYKGGAVLLMNEHLETDIITGTGKAYGVEVMVRKQAGVLTGWIGYTWSRVLLKIDGEFKEERVNGGEYFPANYDKPHDFKLVANARLSRRFNITTDFVYSTGRPITFPVAFYNFYNAYHVFYSNRNEYRIPDHMRLDFSATLNGNLKAKKLNHSSLTATVYNVLGRRNPYSIFFKNEDGIVKGYQLTIFGQPVFMLTYNFRLFGNAESDF